MFRTLAPAVALAAGVIASASARAEPLPSPVVAMIEASEADPAVVGAARATNPRSHHEIDALVDAITARLAVDRQRALASRGFFQGWTGEGQAGGFISSGNSDDAGVALGLNFAKETFAWKHAFTFSADYQRSDGAVSKERYFGGYAGQRKLNRRAFVSITLSAERDRFAGFHSRLSEGLGIGYRLLDSPRLKLDLAGGPALRQTDYIGEPDKAEFAANVAGNFQWTITPDTIFTQTAQTYLSSGNSTFAATTSLTTKLREALSARASIDVRHETDPPDDREPTDTTSRVTLVYSF
jgi:putative salt-induced outer membrane protein